MPEVLTKTQRDVQPPQTGFVRFCPRCGRNDRVGSIKDRHFAGGELCMGEIVTLEYALVNSEHAGLERLVIEAAKKWRRAQGEYAHPAEVDAGVLAVVRAWFGLRKATDALLEFESQQQIKK